MLQQLGRETLLVDIVVAARVRVRAEKVRIHFFAVCRHIVECERFHVVVLDFLGRTGAIPHTDFIYPALEELGRLGLERHVAVHQFFARTDEACARIGTISFNAIQGCVLFNLEHACRWNQRGCRVIRRLSVHVELKRFARVRQGQMRPLICFERPFTLDTLATGRFARSRLYRIRIVEETVGPAVLDADPERRA